MEFYVYQLRREDSKTPFYIGKGSGYRMHAHFTTTSLKGRSWKNGLIKSAMKAGVEVKAEKLAKGLTEHEAMLLETKLIQLYGRRDIGTGILANMTDGGEGSAGNVCSEERKQKIGNANRGRVISEEGRQRMSAAKLGKKSSPEVIANRAAKNTGKKRTADTKARMSASYTEAPHVACRHCGKIMSPKLIGRWHNDRCKQLTK